MAALSPKFNHIRPGVVVIVQRDQSDNRVRRTPEALAENANVTAWLEAGKTRAVILAKPDGWSQDYPYQKDDNVWVYVYAVKAKDHSTVANSKTQTETEVVGWTSAGPIGGSEVYLETADIKSLSK